MTHGSHNRRGQISDLDGFARAHERIEEEERIRRLYNPPGYLDRLAQEMRPLLPNNGNSYSGDFYRRYRPEKF